MGKKIILKLRELLMQRRATLLYIAVFLIACSLLVHLSANIINPDGVEYVAIAKHYASLNFEAAINGIWSPLLSWIFVIPLHLSVDPFLFFRFSIMVLSVLTIILFDIILRGEFKNSSKYPYLYHAGMVFITSFCFYATILTPVTPDLFSVFFILCLVLAVKRYEVRPTLTSAVLIGLAAGAGYYGKNYFFYFAVTTYVLYFLVKFLRNKKIIKQLFLHLVVASIASLALVGPWVGLMSVKYGHLTTNPIAAYSMGQVGPNYPGAFTVTHGLLKPPYSDSFTAREDPTKYDYSKWSPLNSKHDIKYYFTTVLPHNIQMAFDILLTEIIVVWIVLCFTLYESKPKKFLKDHYKSIALITASIIYVGGYCLVHIDGGFRYVWPAYVLSGLALLLMVEPMKRKVWPYILISGILILSLYPIYSNNHFSKFEKEGRQREELAKQVESSVKIPQHAKIATNSIYEASYVCYHLNLQCYGKPKPSHVDEQLKQYDIDYFFEFNNFKQLDVKGTVVYSNKTMSVIKPSND